MQVNESQFPLSGAFAAPGLTTQHVDCWNQQGILGTATCPELTQLVHCKNCPTFSSAAAELLERPLPDSYQEQWTQRVALSRNARELRSGSFIIFRIGVNWLALPMRCLQELASPRPIHSVPHQKPFLLGLVNIRGELLVCVSLAHFLTLRDLPAPATFRADYHRLVVLNYIGARACFPVHEVQGPCRIPKEDPGNQTSAVTSCIVRLQHRSVAVLDAGQLCSALLRTLA